MKYRMSNSRKLFLLSVLTAALILLSVGGCTLEIESSQTTESPAVTTSATPLNPTWTYTGAIDHDPALPSFVEVVEKARPSVVVIETDTGAGSGWIIDSNGIIVTNYHVIEDATHIFVTLDDGRTFTAESVRSDPKTDIAVVYIDADNLPAADISDCCQLKVGQPVAAIGNALGMGVSLKGGWISRLDVSATIEGQTLYGLIETDAAINEGNSGGPLVNIAGEVIGITSIKLIDVGIEGVGYAIGMDTAMPVIEDLITLGYVVRPFLGITGMSVNYSIATLYELDINSGVLLTDISSGYPAEQAGLEIEDVIVAIDDVEIKSLEELIMTIRSKKEVGQQIKITYWRSGSQHTTYATLVEMPE